MNHNIKLQPLPKPYKAGKCEFTGIPIVKILLHPSLKTIIDTMHKIKGCYIGIVDGAGTLYIENQPSIKINSLFLDDIKCLLADDVKEYHDITEYRLLPERYKQINDYYRSY